MGTLTMHRRLMADLIDTIFPELSERRKEKATTTTLYCSPEMLKELTTVSRELHRSRNEVITRVLEYFLREYRGRKAGKPGTRA